MRNKKVQRLYLRATDEQKELIEQAALFKQVTVSDFMLSAAYMRAQKVVKQYSGIYFSNTDWRILRQALENGRLSPAARKLINRKDHHSDVPVV